MKPIYYEYDASITCLDTMYLHPGHAACYLLVHNDRAAFIDTGTGNTVPYILELLKLKNLSLDDVDYVIPTHVHLDHAGGAGLLMSKFPNAQLVIHPRGARHMIDPNKLIIGATAVYGTEKFKKYFGQVVPIDENRVIVAENDATIELSGRTLNFIDTPGHARHHFCVFDELSNSFFTGDTFGLSYRELDNEDGAFILPTTTPVQFEPDAWQDSLTRMLSFEPKYMYVTHFGEVTEVTKLAEELRDDISQYANIAREHLKSHDRKEKIFLDLKDYLQKRLKARYAEEKVTEFTDYLTPDLQLNAAGLDVWLSRLEKAA